MQVRFEEVRPLLRNMPVAKNASILTESGPLPLILTFAEQLFV